MRTSTTKTDDANVHIERATHAHFFSICEDCVRAKLDRKSILGKYTANFHVSFYDRRSGPRPRLSSHIRPSLRLPKRGKKSRISHWIVPLSTHSHVCAHMLLHTHGTSEKTVQITGVAQSDEMSRLKVFSCRGGFVSRVFFYSIVSIDALPHLIRSELLVSGIGSFVMNFAECRTFVMSSGGFIYRRWWILSQSP